MMYYAVLSLAAFALLYAVFLKSAMDAAPFYGDADIEAGPSIERDGAAAA